MTPPTTREPHLVSKVVLRAWAAGDGQFVRYDLASGKSKPSGPDGMGFTRDLALDSAPTFEGTWSEFENAWPRARAAVEDGSAVGDPEVVALLRRCLAVHMARTHDVMVVHDLTMARAVDESVASISRRPAVAQVYRDLHGRDAPGPDDLRDLARQLLEDAARDVRESSFTADAIVAAYEEACRLVDDQGVELYEAVEGEFLIGDAPAQTVGGSLDEIGAFEGVSWNEAASILMPITRRHAIALGPDTCLVPIGREDVHRMNAAQIRAAHAHVAWHPDAGLEPFASAVRAKLPARREPAFPDSVSLDITMLTSDEARL